MKLKIYQVDAFANNIFGGNPAAVCPLEEWLPDETLQKIALENNLSETAFYVKKDNGFYIRWLTPTVEVNLCGHATLAAAYVLFFEEGYTDDKIVFDSRSGHLVVTRQGDILTLDFPAAMIEPAELTPSLLDCFEQKPLKAFRNKTFYMLVFENESQVANLNPHLQAIAKLDSVGVIVTAKGDKVDFVSRFFGPQSGIDEDPVTGSAHTLLTPYWSKMWGKNELTAVQLSARKGYLTCTNLGERVLISGKAFLYMKGEVYI